MRSIIKKYEGDWAILYSKFKYRNLSVYVGKLCLYIDIVTDIVKYQIDRDEYSVIFLYSCISAMVTQFPDGLIGRI